MGLSDKKRFYQRAVATALVAAGLLLNKWSVELLFIPDGTLDSASLLIIVLCLQLVLVATGVWVWVARPSIPNFMSANSLTTVCSLLLALVIVDFVLRYVHWSYEPNPRIYVNELPNRPSQNFEIDEHTGWRMRSSHTFDQSTEGQLVWFRSNSQGFRSTRDFSEYPLIALAGDSFAFGAGVNVEDTFGTLIEKNLHNGTFYNFAMPGFGIDQMWMSVRSQILPRYTPQMVIVAFIDQDWDRSLTAYRVFEGFNKPRFVLSKSGLRGEMKSDQPNLVLRLLDRYSSLFAAGVVTSRRIAKDRPHGEWWNLNSEIIKSIAEDCESHDVPVLFVRLPTAEHSRFPALTEFMNKQGLHYLDLAKDPPSGIHFTTDPHINADGHKYVATSILEILRGHPLISPLD